MGFATEKLLTWTGGAYTSNIVVPRNSFKVTKGSPKSYTVTGDSGKKNEHWFCGSALPPCGLWRLYPLLQLPPANTPSHRFQTAAPRSTPSST